MRYVYNRTGISGHYEVYNKMKTATIVQLLGMRQNLYADRILKFCFIRFSFESIVFSIKQ